MPIDESLFEKVRDARILIVDDDMDMTELIRRQLMSSQFRQIDVVHSGTDALDRLLHAVTEHDPYELVVLDLCLPGAVGGREVYNNICGNMDVSIVIVSALAAREEIRDALKTGVVEEYLVKPVDMEILTLKIERIINKRMFARQLQQSHRRNQMLFLNILQVMAKVLEAKDPYTKFHSENVAKYARQIAKRIGYDEEHLELIQIAGVLHDFGKIGIKEAVLNKPGGLTNFEYEAVKRHPLIASAILEPIEELRHIINDIRHHHERWDGGGYPDGLKGEGIPIGARILAVADAYDAMTSSRAYHDPMTEDEALAELSRCRGSQFDPGLVDVFLDIQRENRDRRSRIVRLREHLG